MFENTTQFRRKLGKGYPRNGWTAAGWSQWKYVWKAPDLMVNSSAAKCADRLSGQKSPIANCELESRMRDVSPSVILPVWENSDASRSVETYADGMGWERRGGQDGFALAEEFDK